MSKRISILFLTAAAITASGAAQQSVNDIRRQKQTMQQEIKETSRKISQNKRQTRNSLNALNRITSDIATQQKSIAALNKQIHGINAQIAAVNATIGGNNKTLDHLRDNYLRAIQKMRSRHASDNKLMFLFSSESFHQAYRRMRYLKEFSRWREHQTGEIRKVQQELEKERATLLKLQQQKSATIAGLNKQSLALESKKAEQSRLVASLQAEGTELQQVLREKEQEARALDRQLNSLIAEEERKAAERAKAEASKRKAAEAERRRQAEEARKAEEARIQAEKKKQDEEMQRLRQEEEKQKKKAEKKQQEELKKRQKELEKRREALRKQEEKLRKEREEAEKAEKKAASGSGYTMDNEEYRLSGSFASNKGKLPFPVSGNSRIVRGFGRQRHPELRYVETDNAGIDIEAARGAQAKVVFDGKVSAIFQQPGYNNIVMVRHGNYLTIYAGLSDIYVKTGDKVKTGQAIGRIFSDIEDENRTLLHFEIRKEREKLNPQAWLRH